MKLEFFMEAQDGVYTPAVAGYVLKLSPSGLFSAAERGKLDYVQFQGRRLYGRKSVKDYKKWYSRKKFAEKKDPDKVCVLTSKKHGLRIEVPLENMYDLARPLKG